MARILISFFFTLFSIYLSEQASFLNRDHIENINKVAATWKAGVNFNPDTPKETILRLLDNNDIGDLKRIKSPLKTYDPNHVPDNYIFKHFDARKRWRHCLTINDVRDQGNCKSGWAFGATGAFADRLCIATKGKFNRQISAEHLLFCSYNCGHGCKGGYPIYAWQYFSTRGAVSGGGYNTSDGCQPYKVKPCHHDKEGVGSCSSLPLEEKHDCSESCYGDHSIQYDEDNWTTRDYYFISYATIQKDLLTYGPLQASFVVFDDFFSYKSGVYVPSSNASLLGSHSTKLIGWGVEQGVDYWLLVNSWGSSWGDNGLFKIRRGTDECLLESNIIGGVPDAGSS